MQGLMMDYQLNVPAILRRGDELYGDREIVSRLPDKSWHRYTYADFASRAKRLAVALRGLGLGRRRPRRDAHVEPPRAPRDVRRRAGRRLRHAHAQPPPPPRRQHVHRDARGRPRARRRQGALAARLAVRRPRRVRARDRGRRGRDAGRARSTTRSCSRRPTRARSPTATSTSAPPRRCASRAARPACRRASSTRTARSRSTRSRPPGCSASTRATPSSRSSRCSTRTRGASRSRARSSARSRCSRAAPRPAEPARRLRRGGGDGQRRRADDLDGDPAGARREPDGLGPVADADDDRRRLGAAARDDRGVRRAARPPHHARLGHDGDVPDRDDLGRAGPGARPRGGRRVRQARPAGAAHPVRRDPRARREGLVPWDGESMGELEVRGPSISSAYYESPDSADRWTDDGWFKTGDIVTIGPTATSRSRIARRTSSSRAASGSRRSRSRTR